MSDINNFSPLWGIWEIGELIGKGSYGSVYKVSRNEHGAEYVSAVKHIAIPLEPSFTQSLYSEGIISNEESEREYYKQVLTSVRDEIRTNYRLRGNSNIVSYEDHIVVPRKNSVGYDIFIRMELLSSLPDYIRDKKNNIFTESDIIKLGCDMCDALDILEHENILHRDIKTSNIFATSSGKYKLGDFGVSRSIENSVTHMSVKGTFDYMPPEIQYGNPVNHTADIYSLGLVLYRLCNGNRKPFLPMPPTNITHEENNIANQKRLQGMPLPAPAMASAALAEVILRACAYEPQNRYQHASELKQALSQISLVATNGDGDDERTIGMFDNLGTGGSRYSSGDTAPRRDFSPPPPPPPGPKQKPTPPPPPPPEPKRKSKALPIIIGLALVAFTAIATVGILSLIGGDDAKDSSADIEPAVTASADTIAPEATMPENSAQPMMPPPNQTTTSDVEASDSAVETTPTATAAPTPTATAAVSQYLISNSASGYVTDTVLANLSWEELCLARNEIYARHGYSFQTQAISEYFMTKSWYVPLYTAATFDTSVLNSYETYNINYIANYENTHFGGSYY